MTDAPDLKETLARLSAKATAGEAKFDEDWNRRPTLFIGGEEVASIRKTWSPDATHTPEEAATARFLTTLVNAYRANHLCVVPSVEDMQDALAAAYATGAEDVHNSWVNGTNGGEPDFGEAASDYARTAIHNLLTGEA